jgi:hypothetical protein
MRECVYRLPHMGLRRWTCWYGERNYDTDLSCSGLTSLNVTARRLGPLPQLRVPRFNNREMVSTSRDIKLLLTGFQVREHD